jgi:hypothetical protein
MAKKKDILLDNLKLGSGWHEVEFNNGVPFRWTEKAFSVSLSKEWESGDSILLDMENNFPHNEASLALKTPEGSGISSFSLKNSRWKYSINLPGRCKDLIFELSRALPPHLKDDDPKELGVKVFGMELQRGALSDDSICSGGWHSLERAGGERFRWTKKTFSLSIPRKGEDSLCLDIESNFPDRDVRLSANGPGGWEQSLVLKKGRHTYYLIDFPGRSRGRMAFELSKTLPQKLKHKDKRQLGVKVFGARFFSSDTLTSTLYTSGWYGPEGTREEQFRWTKRAFSAYFPHRGEDSLMLDIKSSLPERDARLTIKGPEGWSHSLKLNQGRHNYYVFGFPKSSTGHLGFELSRVLPPHLKNNDPKELGVKVFGMEPFSKDLIKVPLYIDGWHRPDVAEGQSFRWTKRAFSAYFPRSGGDSLMLDIESSLPERDARQNSSLKRGGTLITFQTSPKESRDSLYSNLPMPYCRI